MSLDKKELSRALFAVFRRYGELGVGGEQAFGVADNKPAAVGGIFCSHLCRKRLLLRIVLIKTCVAYNAAREKILAEQGYCFVFQIAYRVRNGRSSRVELYQVEITAG